MHRGSCQCGGVTIVICGQPKWIANCHCNDCRKATGSAFSTYVGCSVEQADIGGTPSEFRSSEGVSRLFCQTCGSPIAYRGSRWPDEVHFFVGLFEDAGLLEPKANVFTNDELPWVQFTNDLPRVPTTSD